MWQQGREVGIRGQAPASCPVGAAHDAMAPFPESRGVAQTCNPPPCYLYSRGAAAQANLNWIPVAVRSRAAPDRLGISLSTYFLTYGVLAMLRRRIET